MIKYYDAMHSCDQKSHDESARYLRIRSLSLRAGIAFHELNINISVFTKSKSKLVYGREIPRRSRSQTPQEAQTCEKAGETWRCWKEGDSTNGERVQWVVSSSHPFKHIYWTCTKDIWYNKWAGGDREDSYSKYVSHNCINVLLPNIL